MRAKILNNNLPKEKPVGKANNLIGKKFGRLTVLYRCEVPEHIKNKSQTYWVCKCDCGNYIQARTGALITNGLQSCGCLHSEKAKESMQRVNNKYGPWNIQNLTNKRFGKLVAIDSYSNNKKRYWRCKCDCGKERVVETYYLTKGIIQHCGCVTKSNGILKIEDWLKNHNYDYKNEFSFSDLKDKKSLRFDIAVFKQDKLISLIEFQGEQHSNKNNPWYNESIVIHDKMKIEYCEKNKINLIIINYNDDIYSILSNRLR